MWYLAIYLKVSEDSYKLDLVPFCGQVFLCFLVTTLGVQVTPSHLLSPLMSQYRTHIQMGFRLLSPS